MAELRIVAGEWRGRRITVPRVGVRPTADRVREAWMSIVNQALDGSRVVDLCAGSGALGLEALSRGATHCDFVESDANVVAVLKANIATLGAESRSAVHKKSVEAWLQDLPSPVSPLPSVVWDLAFADPPYASGLAQTLSARWLIAPFATIFGVEHAAALTLPDAGQGQSVDRRKYGDTTITIYRSGP
jgi:16S rRNA (guanine966-N2)-methyltransferase